MSVISKLRFGLIYTDVILVKCVFFGRDLSPTDKHLPVNKLLKYRSGRYFISFRLKNYLLEYIRNHFDQKKITIKLISDMIGAI